MQQNSGNNDNAVNRIVSQLAVDKKKGIMALCLVAVMVFMWVRVLSNKEPEGAQAALTAQKIAADNANAKSNVQISFTELPDVEGRNDVLTKDFFAVDNWQEFKEGKRKHLIEIGKVAADGSSSEEIVVKIVEKLKLEAVALGENPRAFINDRLLRVGDKLPVRNETNMYECEIVAIEENKVLMRWEETEITLKLAHEVDADK